MDTYALDDTVVNRRTKRRRALLAVLLASSLATLGAGAMSLAVFTDSDSNTGAWSTGSIQIDARPDNDPTIAFSSDPMLPGDTGEQTISVENTGTGELRFDMSIAHSLGSAALLGQLTLDIDAGVCGATTDDVWAGALSAAVLTDVVLDTGQIDDYCFTWELPDSSGNAFQGLSTQATFTFDAEQTKNNP